MAGHHGFEHRLLGKLLGFRLDHQHGVLRAGDDEIEARELHLLDCRIELQLAVDVADARAADRAHEGHAGERQRGGGRDHRQNVGIILEVMRKDRDDHLRVAAIAVGEQRADRAVDEAGDERLALGRASLALEIAARNTAGGEGLFLIIDGEREEVLTGLRRLGGNDGGENSGLAPGGDDGAVGLAGDLAGLEDELAAGPVEFFAVDLEHAWSFSR